MCFGSSRVRPRSEAGRQARACGEEIARLGWTLVSGGYEGAMGEASRGARAGGGRVIGITTAVFSERVPNPALDARFSEPDYLARMSTLLRQGHAFVGLPGGLGTLAEWVTAWCLASLGHLGGPLILFRDPWASLVERIGAFDEVGRPLTDLVRWIEAPDQLREVLGPADPAPDPAAG